MSTTGAPSGDLSSPGVVVVGGGVIGVCCAYYLSKSGARVTLLERTTLSGEASSGNAGNISAGHPPLNRPGRVGEALRWMFDPASPLYIPPRWDPDLWRWLATFARHCTHRHVRQAMAVMAPIGHRTLELFEEMIEEEGLDCEYRRDGYHDVCVTEAGLAAARGEAELIRPHGYHPELLDPDELRRREPALGDAVAGGVFYPEAATVDPLRFVQGLGDVCRARGVRVREGAEAVAIAVAADRVRGVRLADGSVEPADAVVLTTGPFSLRLAGGSGVRLAVQPGKGYHRDVPVGLDGAPPLRGACVLHESSVFCTPLRGRVRFAGTMEFSGMNRVLRPARLAQLTRAARHVFPDLGDAPPLSEWSGLRPMSADGLPLIGELPGPGGAWIATGHGMLGLTLGPVTGEMIADALIGSTPSRHLLALTPARFHGKG
ncbi:MAG: FAD-dependent oxidoreductase [Gemmatimonadota bacterium]